MERARAWDDTLTGKVYVTSFRQPAADEPRLMAWGGWTSDG